MADKDTVSYVCLRVRCRRPCTPYASPITSAHCALSFGTLDAVRSTTLRSPPSARYGRQRQFSRRQPDDDNLSRTRTAIYRTGHRKRPDDDSDLGRTRTATRHKKRSSSHTADTEKRTIDSRTTSTYIYIYIFLSLILLHIIHVPFHVRHLAYCTYIHTFRVFLLYYYSSFKFINCCMVEVPAKCVRIVCICLV